MRWSKWRPDGNDDVLPEVFVTTYRGGLLGHETGWCVVERIRVEYSWRCVSQMITFPLQTGISGSIPSVCKLKIWRH